MRTIREVLRLLWGQGRSAREVALSCGLARSTVKEYERRARAASLSWPLPDVDDAALKRRLFPPQPDVDPDERPLPDWDAVDRSMTRLLLWERYRAGNPNGHDFARYCQLLQA